MSTYTHSPVKRYLAECENYNCDWREVHIHEFECDEAIADHRDKHALHHTCHVGDEWFPDDCRACDYEKPASLRRGRTA